MICNQKFRTMTCFTIVFALVFFSSHLFAQETYQAVEHEAGFYYTVQEGDTLWDLSQRFSDSPYFWPDLWKENDQIANPHWIYPGERIRLFHQKGIESYVLNVVEKEPEPEKEPAKELPYYYYSPIDGIGFIKKTPESALGKIFKVKEDVTMVGLGDVVYIRQLGDQKLALDEKYTIYRTLEPVKDKKTKALIGTQHYLTGIVKITREEPQFAIGQIVQSFRAIQIGDLLMPYQKRSPKITLVESRKGLSGKILAAEEGGVLMGDNSVAFIDKGIADGVKVGQSYKIFYQEKQKIDPKDERAVLLTPINYGTFLVLHTEETTSTILITQSDKPVYPEATFHSPE